MKDFIEKTIVLNGNRVKARIPRKLSPEEREKTMKELLKAIAEIAESRRAS